MLARRNKYSINRIGRKKYNIQYIIGVYNVHAMKCDYLKIFGTNHLYVADVSQAKRYDTIEAAAYARCILIKKRKTSIIFISKCFCLGNTFKSLTKVNKLQLYSHMMHDL